jgi:predicted esterase
VDVSRPIFSLFKGSFHPMAATRLFRERFVLATPWVALILAAAPSLAFAQMEAMRFELGRRLTRFEKAWENATPERRAACVASMESAVRSFFGLQLDTASQWLDRATQDVRPSTPDASKIWLAANRCIVDFEIPWVDAATGTLRFRVRRSALQNSDPGKTEDSVLGPPPMGSLVLTISDQGRPMATAEWNEIVPLADAAAASDTAESEARWLEWQLPSLPAGDYRVSALCKTDDGAFDLIAEGISISRDLDSRLGQVEAWYDANRRGKGDTAVATARWLARELKQGRKGQPTEIDAPWNTWLQDFESLSVPDSDFLKSISKSAPRAYWLQLSNGSQSQIVRLGLPALSSNRVPVIFAFHGAGGSENMFFDAYGAGRLVEWANERGWIVVSPRQSMNGLGMDIEAMLNTLEEWLPIDRDRVMFVGHSMGAAQAIAQASAHPDQVHSVAALGGGGMPRSSLRSSPVRFFVAAGDRDFGRPRAKSLAETLRNLDCRVEYREYSDVEHMVIVQAALRDVFVFLDQPGE